MKNLQHVQVIGENDIINWNRKGSVEVGKVYGVTTTHYLVKDVWGTPYSISKKNRTVRISQKWVEPSENGHYVAVSRLA